MSGAKLTFWGAAGQVTGSMHLLEAAGARILLDAGLFQGHRAEAAALNANLPFDPRRIDAIVVSHAHMDHIGRLPLLVRHGYHGPIYATPATRDLCAVMLPDAAHIQESDARFLAKRGKTGPGKRAPLQPGRRDRGPGPDRRAALPAHSLPAEEPRVRIHRRRPHSRLRVGGSPSHRSRKSAHRVFRRHRSLGNAHHPGPRSAHRTDRHLDRRIHVWKS